MLRWWRTRRRREEALEATASEWMRRHGRRARSLAGWRAIDAYLLGDLREQQRWNRVRALIEEREEG